jgi:HEAT repeat protein
VVEEMSWVPNVEIVEQLKLVLGATLSPVAQERKQATDALAQGKQQYDFNNYLLYILAEDKSSASDIRAAAGLTLKNSLHKDFHIGENEYLLSNILKGLLDSDLLVRNITGNVVTTLFAALGIKQWPTVIPQLLELAHKGDVSTQEGATGALAKICEDSTHILDTEYNGQRPLDFLVPQFIQLTSARSSKVRANALRCLNHIIPLKTQSFLVHIDDFLQRLFALAVDENKDVRKNVCTAFIGILETRPDKIVPHLDGVVNYSLHSIANESEEEVQLEACEFLFSLASSDFPETLIVPHLGNMLPVLLKGMVYTEMDILLLDTRDDADDEDEEKDIRPTNAKSKAAHNDKFNEDEDDDDGNLGFEWNLRKCSAATLDLLASSLPEQVLAISLPILKENITSEHWPLREAAILAFGAVADGGIEFASQQLPALVPFLVERLNDQEPSVRQITCWTLGRYASWICSEADKGGAYSNYFAPTFQAIIRCALDKKKIVQESACSSVAQFIDSADGDLIQPVASQLIEMFNNCFHLYKRKNMVILYDAIQTLVERVELDDTQIGTLLPPLVCKWEVLSDDDKELWSLMECMSSVASVMGEKFAPFALQVYRRAVRILAQCIQLDQQSLTDPNIHTPEKDFIITALDMVDGLCQGLGEHSSQLIDETLVKLLLETFKDINDDVRQSAHALLGDMAINVPENLNPWLDELIEVIIQEIVTRTFDSYAVCNNATWALGEISLRLDLTKYLEKTVGVLIDLLNSQSTSTVLENAAITIGRIGIRSPEFFGPHLPEFALSWSQHMMYLEENEEKETAFHGMCTIILSHPTGLDNGSLIAFVNTVTMYAQPGQVVAELLQKLLMGYKQMIGDDWDTFIQRLDNGYELAQRYGL